MSELDELASRESYQAALLDLGEGLRLANVLVFGERTTHAFTSLMVWLSQAPLEFGLPVIRLIGKESTVTLPELFEGCQNEVLVQAVTEKYGPALAMVLAHQQSDVERSVQAAIEHDCENCAARDVCPNSTWEGDSDGDTIDAEFTAADGEQPVVDDPRNIDLSKFEGPKH